ncbi:MAG: histidine kinase [Bacteroidales bacterium]|nr:histidine kinase [Bacteroidales bacterium]
MINIDIDTKSADNKWIRIIGIPLIGIIMPIIFHNENDGIGLFIWIIISVLLTFSVWEGSSRIVSFLWMKYPWEKNPAIHLLISTIFLISLSLFLIFVLFFINYIFTDYSSDYWQEMKGVNVAMVLITFFTTSIYEGVYLFEKWEKSLVLTAKLEKENIQSQFEALKNQINPHFLFNSLSVLESIIPTDPEKAVGFVNKFAKIYRYVLDVKDEIVVELKDELDFVMSYIFLQKIRFGENLKIITNIDANVLNNFVLPLSLQLLIENAIKHNEISDTYSLTITMTNNKDCLIIKNDLQQIQDDSNSTKIGLKNLTERYKLISDSTPKFYIKENKFIAEIPFLVIE